MYNTSSLYTRLAGFEIFLWLLSKTDWQNEMGEKAIKYRTLLSLKTDMYIYGEQ